MHNTVRHPEERNHILLFTVISDVSAPLSFLQQIDILHIIALAADVEHDILVFLIDPLRRPKIQINALFSHYTGNEEEVDHACIRRIIHCFMDFKAHARTGKKPDFCLLGHHPVIDEELFILLVLEHNAVRSGHTRLVQLCRNLLHKSRILNRSTQPGYIGDIMRFRHPAGDPAISVRLDVICQRHIRFLILQHLPEFHKKSEV